GIDDDLAAGKTGIAIRAADHELPRRVDVPGAVVGDLEITQRLADVGLDDLAHLVGIPVAVQMLRGEHDRSDVGGLAVDVAYGHLALGVGAELAGIALALLAGVGEQLKNAVRVVERSR